MIKYHEKARKTEKIMPLHDVKCLRCGHIQEVFYLPNERPDEQKCNSCGSKQTRYLISPAAIKFGGNIWEKQIEQEAADKGW